MTSVIKIFGLFKKKNENIAINSSKNNNTIPSYLIISDNQKEQLIYRISITKDTLFELYNEDKGKHVIDDINKVVSIIQEKTITIISENEIEREIDRIINNKNKDNLKEKIDAFIQKVNYIVDNIDIDFINEVANQYNMINYITTITTIIDKNYEIFRKLEDDFKSHRYNKSYYEREVYRIKHEINQIKKLKNNIEVSANILKLRGDLYTKSKDKYDLLYNDEVFTNIEIKCDGLLNKLNAKVIDINKKEEIQENNIVLRFMDMDLARNIILSESINKKEDLLEVYSIFQNGIDDSFNYDKNKDKTELVILLNGINKVISLLKDEKYIPMEHINFRMNDLIEAIIVKKRNLNEYLSFNNIAKYDDKGIDKKIDLLALKYGYNK